MDIFDLTGLFGAAGYLGAYLALQLRRDFSKTFRYSFLNMAAAVLVAVSLLKDFNLGAMVIQLSWLLVSMYGIYRCVKYKFARTPKD